jgi:peptide/nickel transport system ATP-binding protein
MAEPLLHIEGLKTYFHTDEGVVKAVDDVTLSVEEGQTLGIVGESGSGKSVTALTVMRLLPEGSSRIAAGRVGFLGKNLLQVSNRQMCDIRGCDIAMVFQEPMTSLNPVFRVGDQVVETILQHQDVSRAEARERAIALFQEVGIPDPESRLDYYPHQMSGGQKQRVMIAMALCCDPKLLIADEPTTALDVTIQAQILALLRSLRDKHRMSMIFITHDLGVVAEIADHVAVMYAGKLVEVGDVVSVFENPQHPYTRGLLACRPRLDTPFRLLPTVDDYLDSWVEDDQVRMLEKSPTEERLSELVTGEESSIITTNEPILSVRHLEVHFRVAAGWMSPKEVVKAVDDISFEVIRGQTLGLVGESGCGKTTAARAILRLVEPTNGVVVFKGQKLRKLSLQRMREVRRDLQMIFQDPYSSLNPRLTIEKAVTEPMIVHGIGTGAVDRRVRAAALLEECGLPDEYLHRYPHEFSGGERQRICIARTLSLEPEFIICDESVSSLDVSVQAQVLNLLKHLQANRGLTYIFISHDLSVVKFMSDVLAVMKDGRIVEMGPAEEVYRHPQESYTRTLIDAIPKDDIEHIRMRQADRCRAANQRPANPPLS